MQCLALYIDTLAGSLVALWLGCWQHSARSADGTTPLVLAVASGLLLVAFEAGSAFAGSRSYQSEARSKGREKNKS